MSAGKVRLRLRLSLSPVLCLFLFGGLVSIGLAAGIPAGNLPAGFPAPRVPAGNPMSPAKVALGRRLFYDPRLSGNATQSCSSCHQQARAFTDGRAQAIGSTGQIHPRSAMSLANVAFSATLTWTDPSVRSLERQAAVPMRNRHPVEMGLTGHEREVLARIQRVPLYRELFREAFPGSRSPITFEHIQKAIASFERTILSGDSAYDRFVWSDDRSTMSDSSRRGMALFFSERLLCSRCHSGFTFSGPAVWQGGPRAAPGFADNGLAMHAAGRSLTRETPRKTESGLSRVPTLRNIAMTGPYMHDGRFASLGDVIDHYARGGVSRSTRSPLVAGFSLTQQEKQDLVAFLESLTDADFLADPRLSDPWQADDPSCPPGLPRTKAPKIRTKG